MDKSHKAPWAFSETLFQLSFANNAEYTEAEQCAGRGEGIKSDPLPNSVFQKVH